MTTWLSRDGSIHLGDPIHGDVEIANQPNGTKWNGEAWVMDVAPHILQIDEDVDAIYGVVIGNRQAEYEGAEKDAHAFKEANYPDEEVPSSVQSWATAKNWTPTEAADDILAVATAWRTAAATIRAQRLLRKEQLRTAEDQGDVNLVLAQWNGFVAAVKSQLGIP